MAIYNKNARVCAACNFWGGNRQATNMGGTVEVDNQENGVCNYQTRRGTQCKEFGSCQFWQRWTALR